MNTGFLVETDVAVPARDGTVLRADLWRPDDNERHPVLVHRTPYQKEAAGDTGFYRIRQLVGAGYAVVAQDTRGRFASEGVWGGLTQAMWDTEARDTYDTVEWAGTQTWSDGAVGLFGVSYPGALCWLGAMARPPHLRAIAPVLIGDRETEYLDTGGAFWLHAWVSWYLNAFFAQSTRDGAAPDLVALAEDCSPIIEHLPLSKSPLFDRPGMPVTLEDLLHGDAAGPPPVFAVDRVTVPVLLVGGWYDLYAARTVDLYRRLRASATAHRLVMGPWTHDSAGPAQGELNLGASASGLGAVQPALLAFFDRHLRGHDTNLPPVRYFVPGQNRWHDTESWPPPGAVVRTWYLHSDGILTGSAPVLDETPDHYRYDPADPVRTLGGRISGNLTASGPAGPRDQRVLAARADVLSYETAPLDAPLVLAGHATVHVHASTSAVDTDFVARLVDVHPDGRAMLVTSGLCRARHRKGVDREVFVEPGAVEEYEIGLGPVAHRLPAGHRLAVYVCSSDFPWLDRNMNTGGPLGADAVPVVAEQTICHGPAHPSRLEIHTLPH